MKVSFFKNKWQSKKSYTKDKKNNLGVFGLMLLVTSLLVFLGEAYIAGTVLASIAVILILAGLWKGKSDTASKSLLTLLIGGIAVLFLMLLASGVGAD